MFLFIWQTILFTFCGIGIVFVISLLIGDAFSFMKAEADSVCTVIMTGETENAEYLVKYFINAFNGIKTRKTPKIIIVTENPNEEIKKECALLSSDYSQVVCVEKKDLAEHLILNT